MNLTLDNLLMNENLDNTNKNNFFL
jgi:hypothetical protein